jgi:hypothetical protein
MLIALGSFAAFNAEIMILEAQFRSHRTLPAGTPPILGYAEGTFTGNAVNQFPAFISTAVIGRTVWTAAGSSFFHHDRFFILCILHPGIFKPL